MKREEARKLIRDTFQDSFNESRFIEFIYNLLNEIDVTKSFSYHGNYIPDAYKKSIKQYKRIGQYVDPQGELLDVLIVNLKRETSLERARTMQRNFIGTYLKERGDKDNALVAFYHEGLEDWRFSYVKREYSIEETESGKIKNREELSPARRFSFLVGKNEPTHTAQNQIVPILIDDKNNPTLSEIEEAFNIETVTKEFFENYRKLYIQLKEELDALVEKDLQINKDFSSKNISTDNFAKKLLGQIVFLYFLQKKGWLGIEKDDSGVYKQWGTGPKNFLRKLFNQVYIKYENFFDEVLEPLFYQALRIDRGEVSEFSQFHCKIPFLNGGLFEPIGEYSWEETRILINNDTIQEILDTFDLYNFTVKEDEPLDKEVAVDPEMLGKVFENLLEMKDRKSKGTYYTPREIVHYMCQESLINYLDSNLNIEEDEQNKKLPDDDYSVIPKEYIENFIRKGEVAIEHDQRVESEGRETRDYSYKIPESIRENALKLDSALASIRICDPAIGSGAFPVGMMQEIVKAREILTTYLTDKSDRNIYNFKRQCIQESLYGVDIDPSAVDIAKLRLWLSLVVDENDFETIKPLPNLDYKIVCGNSLLEIEKNLGNWESFRKLELLKKKYFNETNIRIKPKLKQNIDKVLSQITNDNDTFDIEVYFSEVFNERRGFDVIIGNPPYGAAIKKEEIDKIKIRLKDTKNSNSAALFIDISKNHFINKKGILSFIVPKSLLYSERWFGLVKALVHKTKILLDVEKAFENVKLEQVVFIYSNTADEDNYVAKKFLNNSFIRTTIIPKIIPLKFESWLCDITEKELRIVEEIDIEYVYLNSISVTKRGVGLQQFIKSTGDYQIIGGKNIFRYGTDGIRGYISKNLLEERHKKLNFMLQQKLISQDIIAHIQFPIPHIKITSHYDNTGEIIGLDTVQNTILTNTEYDYKYILAILNSKFTSWYTYKFIYCSAIRTMHFDNYYIGKIMIPNANEEKQKSFVDIVNKIYSMTNKSAYSKTSNEQSTIKNYQEQLDKMVYKLFGLNDEKIAVIEGI